MGVVHSYSYHPSTLCWITVTSGVESHVVTTCNNSFVDKMAEDNSESAGAESAGADAADTETENKASLRASEYESLARLCLEKQQYVCPHYYPCMPYSSTHCYCIGTFHDPHMHVELSPIELSMDSNYSNN